MAAEYGVASVCVKPYFVKDAAEILKGSGVRTGTTIGFPHGGHATSIKLAEAKQALADGAEELDMVVNVGKVLSGDWDFVVIFENCFLADEHKIRLCEICGELGADFVKTSTGYAEGGATLADVKLMREHCPPSVQIKAAGGIRSLAKLLEYRAVGVTRIGASRTADILEACKKGVGSS